MFSHCYCHGDQQGAPVAHRPGLVNQARGLLGEAIARVAAAVKSQRQQLQGLTV